MTMLKRQQRTKELVEQELQSLLREDMRRIDRDIEQVRLCFGLPHRLWDPLLFDIIGKAKELESLDEKPPREHR